MPIAHHPYDENIITSDYSILMESNGYKQFYQHSLRAPIIKKQFKRLTTFKQANERTCKAGFIPGSILLQEQQALTQEGIQLTQGLIPPFSEKRRAFENKKAVLGHDYYLIMRDYIISLFYVSPTTSLTLERCFHFFRREHFGNVAVVYNFLEKFGYINFGQEKMEEKLRGPDFDKTILIVGAGAAGIAASHQLIKMGFKTTIIEGRDRIGGRIHSFDAINSKGDTCRVDLGANVFSGGEENPLYVLCKQNNVSVQTVNQECPLFDCSGEIIHPGVDADAEKQFNALLEALPKFRTQWLQEQSTDISLSSAIEQLIHKTFKIPVGNSKETIEARKSLYSVINWYLADLEYGYGTSLDNISLRCWDHEDEFQFQNTGIYHIGDNFVGCLEGLVRQVRNKTTSDGSPMYQMLFNHAVSSISYHANQKVSVRCSNGKELKGDAIICTVPLGVLKSGNIEFVPHLPEWKRDAINRLGFGTVNKLVLWFESVFWHSHLETFGNCNTTGIGRGNNYLFWNLYKTTKKPVLVVFHVGNSAAGMEDKKNQENLSETLQALAVMFGKEKLSKLLYFNHTRWASDPFSLGSFSHIQVGCSGNDYDLLAQPLSDRLFFCGEATNRHNPATVAGAVLSGFREAGRISQLHGEGPTAFEIQHKYEMASLFTSYTTLAQSNHILPPLSCTIPPVPSSAPDPHKKLHELAASIPCLSDMAAKCLEYRKDYFSERQLAVCSNPNALQSKKSNSNTPKPCNWQELPIGSVVSDYVSHILSVFVSDKSRREIDTLCRAITTKILESEILSHIQHVQTHTLSGDNKLIIRELIKDCIRHGFLQDVKNIALYKPKKRPPIPLWSINNQNTKYISRKMEDH